MATKPWTAVDKQLWSQNWHESRRFVRVWALDQVTGALCPTTTTRWLTTVRSEMWRCCWHCSHSHRWHVIVCVVGFPTGMRSSRSTSRLIRLVSVTCIRNWSRSCCVELRRTWKGHCQPRLNRFSGWRCPRSRDNTTSGFSPRTTRPSLRSPLVLYSSVFWHISHWVSCNWGLMIKLLFPVYYLCLLILVMFASVLAMSFDCSMWNTCTVTIVHFIL